MHDNDGNVSLSYLVTVSSYTLSYIAAVLGVAVLMFQKREVS